VKQQIRFRTTGDGVRIAYATASVSTPIVRLGHWLTHLEYYLNCREDQAIPYGLGQELAARIA